MELRSAACRTCACSVEHPYHWPGDSVPFQARKPYPGCGMRAAGREPQAPPCGLGAAAALRSETRGVAPGRRGPAGSAAGRARGGDPRKHTEPVSGAAPERKRCVWQEKLEGGSSTAEAERCGVKPRGKTGGFASRELNCASRVAKFHPLGSVRTEVCFNCQLKPRGPGELREWGRAWVR